MTWQGVASRILWFLKRPWLLLAAVGTVLLAVAGRRRKEPVEARTASGVAHAAQLDAVGARLKAEEVTADAKLAQETSAIAGMGDDALLADAAARVERGGAGHPPELHRD